MLDDYVPTYNENGRPVFCQPNKTGEFWVLLLEKAYAKVNGSYANINEGTPRDVFKAVTYAPADSIAFDGQHEGEYESVWSAIEEHTKAGHTCSATKLGLPEEIYLKVQHTYTLVLSHS